MRCFFFHDLIAPTEIVVQAFVPLSFAREESKE